MRDELGPASIYHQLIDETHTDPVELLAEIDAGMAELRALIPSPPPALDPPTVALVIPKLPRIPILVEESK